MLQSTHACARLYVCDYIKKGWDVNIYIKINYAYIRMQKDAFSRYMCVCAAGADLRILQGGGGSGQEFFEGGSRSSKRQVRGNCHTDKQKNKPPMGVKPPIPLGSATVLCAGVVCGASMAWYMWCVCLCRSL